MGLESTTVEIPPCLMCQSYCRKYDWQWTNVVHGWRYPGTISRAVRDVLNSTYHDMDRWRETHRMACKLSMFESSGFLSAGTPKSPCVCSSCWQRSGVLTAHFGCLSVYPQLARHLWTYAVARYETCRGMHWISWRTFWALIESVLFQL
jgi:hypothetical protein